MPTPSTPGRPRGGAVGGEVARLAPRASAAAPAASPPVARHAAGRRTSAGASTKTDRLARARPGPRAAPPPRRSAPRHGHTVTHSSPKRPRSSCTAGSRPAAPRRIGASTCCSSRGQKVNWSSQPSSRSSVCTTGDATARRAPRPAGRRSMVLPAAARPVDRDQPHRARAAAAPAQDPSAAPSVGRAHGARLAHAASTRCAGRQERQAGRRALLDEPPQRVGVEVLLDQVAEHGRAVALAQRGEAGVRRDLEPVPAGQPRRLGEERGGGTRRTRTRRASACRTRCRPPRPPRRRRRSVSSGVSAGSRARPRTRGGSRSRAPARPSAVPARPGQRLAPART